MRRNCNISNVNGWLAVKAHEPCLGKKGQLAGFETKGKKSEDRAEGFFLYLPLGSSAFQADRRLARDMGLGQWHLTPRHADARVFLGKEAMPTRNKTGLIMNLG